MPKLHPHQAEAVEKMHNGCILVGDVGTGKSITAVAYYMKREAPKDVIVITTAKKRDSLDWDGEFAKWGVGRDKDSSTAGSLTVDSWNNLGRYRDLKGCFFIFDEQRVVGAGKWTKDFLRVAQHNRWILLSATPGDVWLDYIPVFVANGFYRTRTEFLNTHVVYNRFAKYPKVERYLGVSRLLRLRDQVLVTMPYDRHTIRHVEEVPVQYDQELFKQIWEKRWNTFESRPVRDVAELFLVARRAVNSDSSRLEAVRQLLLVHPRLVVFYNFNYELDALRTLTTGSKDSSTTHSSSPSKRTSSFPSASTRPSQPPTSTAAPTACTAPTATGGSKASTTPSTSTTSTTTSGTGSSSEPIPTPASTGSSSSSPTSRTTGSASAATPLSTRPGSARTTGNSTPAATGGSGPDLVLAEWNGHKHEPIPTSERWIYLVQYTAGSEGWNCTETNAMCFYSLTYSYKAWHQSHGRIDRLDTPFTNLYYYVLMSGSLIDKAIMRALKAKKSFNENRLVPRF